VKTDQCTEETDRGLQLTRSGLGSRHLNHESWDFITEYLRTEGPMAMTFPVKSMSEQFPVDPTEAYSDDSPHSPDRPWHASILIGYGSYLGTSANGEPREKKYWVFQNSWGEETLEGDFGYFYWDAEKNWGNAAASVVYYNREGEESQGGPVWNDAYGFLNTDAANTGRKLQAVATPRNMYTSSRMAARRELVAREVPRRQLLDIDMPPLIDHIPVDGIMNFPGAPRPQNCSSETIVDTIKSALDVVMAEIVEKKDDPEFRASGRVPEEVLTFLEAAEQVQEDTTGSIDGLVDRFRTGRRLHSDDVIGTTTLDVVKTKQCTNQVVDGIKQHFDVDVVFKTATSALPSNLQLDFTDLLEAPGAVIDKLNETVIEDMKRSAIDFVLTDDILASTREQYPNITAVSTSLIQEAADALTGMHEGGTSRNLVWIMAVVAIVIGLVLGAGMMKYAQRKAEEDLPTSLSVLPPEGHPKHTQAPITMNPMRN